jgi:hypothetical protein
VDLKSFDSESVQETPGKVSIALKSAAIKEVCEQARILRIGWSSKISTNKTKAIFFGACFV